MKLGILLLAWYAILPAQEQGEPQFVWEGVVDGTVLMRLHGNRVDLEVLRDLPVQRQRYHFYERLPQSRVNVRLEVAEGRGRVRIVEQPTANNNYTAAVQIEDRQDGAATYSLALFWDTGRGPRFPDPGDWPRGRGGRMESLGWSGRVDGEAVVSCRGNTCVAENVRGSGITRDRYRFSRPLPDRQVTVTLGETSGRGDIRLLEQPSEFNNYTAKVAIRDPRNGSSDYAFTLVWTPPPRREGGFDFSRRGLIWRGRVDGRARVVVANGIAASETISGRPVAGERAQFLRPLPARDNPNVTLRRLRGRGNVEIVEYPSRRNGYRIVFEIDDRSGGASDYEVEVSW